MSDPKTQRKQSDEISEEKKKEAENWKTRGNQSLKAQDFNEAVKFYTKAVELNPAHAVYYSNRAAAYINLKKYKEALVDAEKCIELRSTWARGYGRKGASLFGLSRYSEAIETYKAALRFEPNSSLYKSEINACEKCQKGSSPSFTGRSMGSMTSQAIYYMQFIGHILLIISAIMSILPTRSAGASYLRTLTLAVILQAIIVIQQYGIPKFEKLYWMEIIKNDETHFILAASLCIMSRPFFLGIAGHAMRSGLFLARGTQDLIRAYPNVLGSFNQPIVMSKIKAVINMRYKAYDTIAFMEIIIGIMLVVELLTPARNILLLFAWWQFLRIRYILSSYTKSAFVQITYKLDEWFLRSSWCPSIVGTVYTKIKSFCSRATSPEAQQSSCSVM